ncbi:hypothetical protein MUO65_01060 [bacterium]|nr:hypothetical protein [bacterium]
MNITHIRIHNFGPFYGDHEIIFPNNGVGVHLMRGNTGQGKTSLQRAILWSLYGKVRDRKGKDISPTSLLNKVAQKEKNYIFWVHIHFIHGGKNWVISRQMKAKFNQDSLYESGMELNVTEEGVPKKNPLQEIERIIPQDLSRFYFFDGEMLRDYEDLLEQYSSSIKILKDSIEHILGIPYLTTARGDLNQVQIGFEKYRAKIIKNLGGKEYEKLSEEYEGICDAIISTEDNIKKLGNQIQGLDEEISRLTRVLADLEPTKILAERKIKLDSDIRLNREKIEQELLKLQHLNAIYHKTVLADVSKNIIQVFDEKHRSTMEKYDRKQRLKKTEYDIQDSIDGVKCSLCGHVLDPERLSSFNKQKELIAAEIETLTEVPEPNLQYERYKTILDTSLKSQINRNEYKQINKVKTLLEYDIAIYQTQLDEIQSKLGDVDDKQPSRIIAEIKNFERELGRLRQVKKDEEEKKIKQLETKSILDQQLSSINKDELNILKNRIEMTRKLANIFDEAITIYRENRRLEVEAEATRIFKQLRSKTDFESLKINENYGLYIITKGGDVLDRAVWRSAGEEQIVAFALVGALNKCAQIQAPIFMDAPFGRLDLRHGSQVISYLPQMSQQIVLLVTDRELRLEDEKLLSGYIKSDQTLIHRGEERGSFIIPTPSGG